MIVYNAAGVFLGEYDDVAADAASHDRGVDVHAIVIADIVARARVTADSPTEARSMSPTPPATVRRAVVAVDGSVTFGVSTDAGATWTDEQPQGA